MPTLRYLDDVAIERVSGLSGARGKALRENQIRSVRDLLFHFPRRYIDRSRTEPISQLPVGEEVTVIAEVVSVSTRRPRARLTMTEAKLRDASGTLKAVWFNQAFRGRQLTVGAEVALSGKVERFKGTTQMKAPDVDVLGSAGEGLKTGRVVPIHPNVGKIGSGWVRRGVWNALGRSTPVSDVLPEDILKARKLVGRDKALHDIHFPDSMRDMARARHRLVFDEFFRLEVALALNKRLREDRQVGIVHGPSREMANRFIAGLPYQLTGAQSGAIDEIVTDLSTSYPMQRLLQGEVGSGKTVVAVASLLVAVEGGYQTAVMAPTEVLAVQHFLGIRQLLTDGGMAPPDLGPDASLGMDSLFAGGGDDGPFVRLALLTGSQAAANFDPSAGRAEILSYLAAGNIDILVGTHALIQEGVEFASLGMAVIDEQHRFGAEQRNLLRLKGAGEATPDLLIMTATPIPRTLSMTLYGDLEESIIEELPPGRSPTTTIAASRESEATVWSQVGDAITQGRQVFVVCPLVEDSEKIEAASAESEHQRLSVMMPELRFGLIHGQMNPRDKDAAMTAFRDHETDVLVATTVIEVGIDVPNATIMVIEDADRFGLSQLHQLRGRVGRGKHPGTCILLADPTTPEGERRIDAMVRTNDGFVLAQEDLEIRGQGTVFAASQSGRSDLRLANIVRDRKTLIEARDDAFELVDLDPQLIGHADLLDEVLLFFGDDEEGKTEWLFIS